MKFPKLAVASLVTLAHFVQGVMAQTPPAVPPERIEQARRLGAEEGRFAGQTDGRNAGIQEGRAAGERDGYRNGFDRCEREERERENDRGMRDGFLEGERVGQSEGRRDGALEGDDRGEREGREHGTRRADNEARNAATGPGRERGYQEANQSDASSKGQRDGISEGDQAARAEAERVDYPRGREDLRRERWAEPIAREDEFKQKNPAQVADAGSTFSGFAMASVARSAMIKPLRRTMPTPEEQSAYDSAYNSAYRETYNGERQISYNQAYREAHNFAVERGCRDARNRDYRDEYRRGYERGRNDGYRRAYDRAYNDAFRLAYDQAFRDASNRAYRDNYDNFYKRHFESARSEAYRERYNQLYQAAYRPAFDQKYAQVYPGYAQAAYQRGRNDETQDFNERPLRLTASAATETIANGVFEPGEALRVRLQVRNFAGTRLEPSRVKVQIVAEDSTSAVISEPASQLVKALEAKSLTTVSEALEFRMNEARVGKSSKFRLEIYVGGKLSDQKTFTVDTRFWADLALAAQPDVKEGLPTEVAIKVKNNGQVATDNGMTVELANQPGLVDVLEPVKTVGALAAGEERVVRWTVIGRSSGAKVTLPLALTAKTGVGRRIGALNLAPEVPVSNDYRIEVVSGLENLRQAGVARIRYRVTNVGSRALVGGLQMTSRFSGNTAENFAVVGPNPQYLAPLIPGQSTEFVVPVVVKQTGQDGELELEVKEEGRLTVVHRRKF